MALGVVIPIQSTDAGKEQVKAAIENLGQQISNLVQTYNEKRGEIEGASSDPAIREKFRQLWEQRKNAIRALIASFVSARTQSASQGIQTATQNLPALQGLGADDLNGLSTAVQTEQTKLAALATYYEAYKASISSNTAPPALPPELAGGSVLGISPTYLAIGVALIAAFFMFKGK